MNPQQRAARKAQGFSRRGVAPQREQLFRILQGQENEWVPTDLLATLLYGESTQQTRRALAALVGKLRQARPDRVIESRNLQHRGGFYRLLPLEEEPQMVRQTASQYTKRIPQPPDSDLVHYCRECEAVFETNAKESAHRQALIHFIHDHDPDTTFKRCDRYCVLKSQPEERKVGRRLYGPGTLRLPNGRTDEENDRWAALMGYDHD